MGTFEIDFFFLEGLEVAGVFGISLGTGCCCHQI